MQKGQRRRKALISAELFEAFQTTFVAIVFVAFFGVLFLLNGSFTVHAIQTVAAQFANPLVMPTDGPSRQIVQVAIWLLDWRVAWGISITISFFEAWGWQTRVRGISRTAIAFMLFDVGTTVYGLYLVGASQGLDYSLPAVLLYAGLALIGATLMALSPEYAIVEALGYIGLFEVSERAMPLQSMTENVKKRRQQARKDAAVQKRRAQARAGRERRRDDDDDYDDEYLE